MTAPSLSLLVTLQQPPAGVTERPPEPLDGLLGDLLDGPPDGPPDGPLDDLLGGPPVTWVMLLTPQQELARETADTSTSI